MPDCGIDDQAWAIQAVSVLFRVQHYHIVQEIIDTTYVTVTPADDTFFYVFYSLQLISVSLSIAVLYELFQSVLGPYDALRNVSGKLFVWMSLALLVHTGRGIRGSAGYRSPYRLFRVVYLSERSLRIVQLGLLICLVAVSRSLALSWRTYCFWNRLRLWGSTQASISW